MRIVNVVGARPNFMKIAPLMAAYGAHPELSPLLVHTGQHYDRALSELFFEQLGIPRPDLNLGVGSGSHAVQTAEIMLRFEAVCLEHRPDWVLVVGDVNSTIACALVACKLGIRVAHVEAGLRSGDRAMPEEINRILTDALADLLFVSEPSGVANLHAEGVDPAKVHLVGNVMIDTLLANRERARGSDVLQRLGLQAGAYVPLTLHRPSNVDHPEVFRGILDALEQVAARLPVVLPAHPRTVRSAERLGLAKRLRETPGLRVVEPLGYLDFLALMANARVVMTDSGGIQEETTVLKVPCVTLRHNTERPVTCEMGGNRLAGTDPARIVQAFDEALAVDPASMGTPEGWDGKAATRIAAVLAATAGAPGGESQPPQPVDEEAHASA